MLCDSKGGRGSLGDDSLNIASEITRVGQGKPQQHFRAGRKGAQIEASDQADFKALEMQGIRLEHPGILAGELVNARALRLHEVIDPETIEAITPAPLELVDHLYGIEQPVARFRKLIFDSHLDGSLQSVSCVFRNKLIRTGVR